MRFINCYVENYGTLSRYRVDFNQKLTVINEENGFGKSTLCSFIKAMFYGLPQTSKHKIEENERKLRTPWQGGSFGGTLDFEVQNKQYRIERFFGVKANADAFRLLDLKSGTECNDFSENIGTELFGIDAEGFERSVFFPQLESETFANTSISAKLMNLVENSDDINNFDKAMNTLKKRKNEYMNARNKGIVSDLQQQIDSKEHQIHDGRVATENIAELTLRLKQCEALISEKEILLQKIRQDIKSAASVEAALVNLKRKQELEREMDSLKANLAEFNSAYPNGLPKSDRLEETLKKAQELTVAENELNLLLQDQKDETALAELQVFFGEKSLSHSELESVKQKATELRELKYQAETKKNILDGASCEKNEKKAPVKLLSVLAAVITALGCVLLIKSVIAVVVILAGFVVGAVAAFLYLKGMISRNAPNANISVLKSEYESLSSRISALDAELTAFFKPFCIEGDFVEKAYALVVKADQFKTLLESVSAKRSLLDSKKTQVDTLKKFLLDVFSGYECLPSDYQNEILKMRDASKSFDEWTATLKDCEDKLSAIPELPGGVSAESFDSDALVKDEKAVSYELDAVRKTAVEYGNRIASLKPIADSVPELEDELETLKETLKEKEQELFTLEKTMEFLETAKQRLSLKYRDVMTDGFKKYADMMLGADIGGFLLDPKLNVNVERHGRAQEKAVFSTGYQNLIDIATRLALIDALYGDNKPPVILDDPFVNFDETRTENALKLIEKLSENCQVVYLTCHGSRVP